MGYIAKGLYRELLDEAWVEGSIPNDMSTLADICGCPIDVMDDAWPRIVVCWILNENGRWINEKLESLRTEVDAIRVIKAESGRLGGLAKTKAALISGHAPAEDLSNIQKAEDQARDELAGAKQQLADAKHVLADASECHIEEEEKTKRKEKPSGKPVGDSRHGLFREQIDRYWKHYTGQASAPWNGSEGKALSELLAAKPDLTLEDFRKCLKNRGDTPSVVQTDRPRLWIPNILRYLNGPLDRFNAPVNGSASKPALRGVTMEEAMQR